MVYRTRPFVLCMCIKPSLYLKSVKKTQARRCVLNCTKNTMEGVIVKVFNIRSIRIPYYQYCTHGILYPKTKSILTTGIVVPRIEWVLQLTWVCIHSKTDGSISTIQ